MRVQMGLLPIGTIESPPLTTIFTPKTRDNASMRKAISTLVALAVLAAVWCSLFSCSSLQGEMAPPLLGGTQVTGGLILSESEIPKTDWRLLAFFSPN